MEMKRFDAGESVQSAVERKPARDGAASERRYAPKSVQRRQADTSHLFEDNIRLSGTGVGLIGIMTIDNGTAVKKYRITAPSTAIDKTDADEPNPSLNRTHPARLRYFE